MDMVDSIMFFQSNWFKVRTTWVEHGHEPQDLKNKKRYKTVFFLNFIEGDSTKTF
jgi:hypothetical protein